MKELIQLLWRGALGGMLLQLALSAFLLLGYPDVQVFLWLCALLLIPASVGALIALVLWLISRITHVENGLITRVVVGVIFANLLCALFIYLAEYGLSYAATDYGALLATSIIIGVEIGMPAGILARKREEIVIQQLGLLTSFPFLKQESEIAR
jgi:ABC-type proline/glycine betaine transport system permease subunit